MYCPNCGKPIPDDSVFCPECGARVDYVERSPMPPDSHSTPDPAPAPNSVPPSPAPTSGTDSPNPYAAPQNGTPKKRKRHIARVIVPIVAAALVLAGLVTAGMLTGWFGLLGAGAPVSGVTVRDSLGDYSWDELSKISEAISSASTDEEALAIAAEYNLCSDDGALDPNQTKSVELSNGASSSVRIIGFRHDDKSDDSGKAGITFAFTKGIAYDLMSTRGSNQGGWQYSDLRSRLNAEYLGMLPDDLGSNIVEVNKSTNNDGAAYDDKSKSFDESCVSTTADKLWLPSYVELVGEVDGKVAKNDSEGMCAILNSEGSQYQLYAESSLTPDQYSDLVKPEGAEGTDPSQAQDGGIAWTRTPDPLDSRYAYTVNGSSERCNEGHTVAYRYLITPCFCI